MVVYGVAYSLLGLCCALTGILFSIVAGLVVVGMK
jgi:hypothetical protein